LRDTKGERVTMPEGKMKPAGKPPLLKGIQGKNERVAQEGGTLNLDLKGGMTGRGQLTLLEKKKKVIRITFSQERKNLPQTSSLWKIDPFFGRARMLGPHAFISAFSEGTDWLWGGGENLVRTSERETDHGAAKVIRKTVSRGLRTGKACIAPLVETFEKMFALARRKRIFKLAICKGRGCLWGGKGMVLG